MCNSFLDAALLKTAWLAFELSIHFKMLAKKAHPQGSRCLRMRKKVRRDIELIFAEMLQNNFA
jgi:hypothetical protein